MPALKRGKGGQDNHLQADREQEQGKMGRRKKASRRAKKDFGVSFFRSEDRDKLAMIWSHFDGD